MASAISEESASNAHSESVGMGAVPLGVGAEGVTGTVAVETAPTPLALLARTVKV